MAKIYLRWFIATTDDDELGFMLVRAVGPTKQTRSGHVWERGKFYVVDDFESTNTYSSTAPYQLLKTHLRIQSGDRVWEAEGTPSQWLPLRHLSKDENGDPAHLRIVKSPTRWTFGDGRLGAGTCEDPRPSRCFRHSSRTARLVLQGEQPWIHSTCPSKTTKPSAS
ncbi:hypothetical protein [Aeromicrobium sp. UC242_57]|uniref:DUF7064 domain-containing protein n=1 Tax=Aeromicrobium sp. UC242_57 TaxID=3374624 RepID=UPI0037946659